MSRTGLMAAAGLAACAGAAAPAQGPGAPPTAYHGVVVWLHADGARTQPVAFTPQWERRAAGTDSVLAFSRVALPDGWGASGSLRGDTLTWYLSRMSGDAGTAVEFTGVAGADGRVSGCALPPRRGSLPVPIAAFVLVPANSTAPNPSDALLEQCRRARATSSHAISRPGHDA